MGDTGRRCWTSSPQRMWEGWCPLWSRVTPGVRCQSGSSGIAGSGKRSGRRRRRSWVLWGKWVPGRNCRCSYPRPPSWHRLRRSRERVALSLYSFFCSFLYLLSLGTGAWAECKGELPTCRRRADCGQETGQNVRRPDLYRSNASMIKQKKNLD